MGISRESIEFGGGSFVGKVLNDPEFYEQPIRDQARLAGWANGCPVVEELTDPANPNPGRGPEVMLERYAQVNFWFGHIAREVEAVNPHLYEQLVAPVLRSPDEPIGKYEQESVPDSYSMEMAPLGTLPGYALPRLFVKQLGENLSPEESRQRLLRGMSAVHIATVIAETPEELLVITAEGLANADVPPLEVLGGVMSEGWFSEHNATSMLERTKDALQKDAPRLWSLYCQLTPEDRRQNKIV